MQHIKHNAQAGFTLLEILIAMMLMATIITALFGLFTNVIDASQHARNRMDIDKIGRAVLSVVEEDFRYMSADAANSALKFDTTIDADETYAPEEEAVMGFPTTSSLKLKKVENEFSLQYVTYTLLKDDDDRYTLYRIEKPYPTISDDFTELKYEIVSDMLNCKFFYYDKEYNEFKEEWGVERTSPPAAIKFEFSLGEKDNPHEYSLVIPLPEDTI
ncbi:prepilin-type N-terminal cleavage/methylation domain-containing protein [Halodesulfovibrio sp.]|jgi:type II secretion system protein J|uniref:prepilin-type N-terminal cleavage/methylation domain-containing protein n=1 Tax=Halodesulfovibrio sp. TaxID=1912772 RepID=UPI0025F56177|nr:prepilin-type N-terminal cleavage/methylation domain-containing protein [Halodesulfovibrio sp.]MCT4535748.1 prepilin-type N-terminal cleavage/methylation domain-containing protein [Halodesulfovibrio sp.]MCT4627388.1 prepilin-type N-terminal cleavage/methylation domain-containing protein [Halodesulfovibrio sp.]